MLLLLLCSTTPTYPSKPTLNSTPPTTLLHTHHFIPPSHPFNLLLSIPSLFQLLLHHFYSSFILPSPPPPFISITIPPSLSPNPSQISPLPLHPMNPLNSTHQTLPPTHPPTPQRYTRDFDEGGRVVVRVNRPSLQVSTYCDLEAFRQRLHAIRQLSLVSTTFLLINTLLLIINRYTYLSQINYRFIFMFL